MLDHVTMEDLRNDEDFNTLIAFMKLGKDDLDDNFEKYKEFKNYIREQDQKFGDYIHEFEAECGRYTIKVNLPSDFTLQTLAPLL